jgi:hypothetical protein
LAIRDKRFSYRKFRPLASGPLTQEWKSNAIERPQRQPSRLSLIPYQL